MEDSLKPDFKKRFYLECGFATRSLHAGEHVDETEARAHTGAIYQTSTFVFDSAEQGAGIFSGEVPGYVYTRLGNPTVRVLEAKINALEGGDFKKAHPEKRVSTLAFSSGMAAVSAALMTCVGQGDTILLGNVVYGATEHLCSNVLSRYGVRTVEVDMSDPAAVQRSMEANPKTAAVFFETPMNPTMGLVDIDKTIKIVKGINPKARVIVDNTFCTPYLQRPLEYGADMVMHSTTKYLCGHGVVVGGVVTVVDDELRDGLYKIIKDVGSSPSPFDCWLVNLGIKTLPLRMEKHCTNALAVAKFLAEHPKVSKVFYPGLPSHPQHELAKRQMKAFGGVVSFELKGGTEAGRKLMNSIKVWTLAVSLGCVDSLIQHPASMTHACVPRDKRIKGGISDGLVRASVGVEDVDDLIRALDEALANA
jgi:methionine-gamma-lyase